ncbi:uncharacterized protein BP01DRAFT_383761 [Aspergillus saccharolyticus JOP 1030-1]|uniref:Protein kinase domain-containing protein n=1 Tax=Aspergillus saccharolyticus JOP 1030-1 TaxID=1450539 RepID=A0A318ZKG2_9EURO|nr:hypothetical protein BP01DRAFT_383761 [Aspergillus saccharolyticus JOP 1030-1]PYH44270.1 hypothetical protein BP01DRAFT_383761 [Aspergillus saccharolyticus JOP 1030-1]
MSSLGLLLEEKADPPRLKQSMWHRLGLRRWLGREDRDSPTGNHHGGLRPPTTSTTQPNSPTAHNNSHHNNNNHHDASSSSSPLHPSRPHDNLTRRLSRKVGVGLPRATTFKRQNSERRDRLSPTEELEPRRTVSAVSADRRRPLSSQSQRTTRSPPPTLNPRVSAPEVQWRVDPDEPTVDLLPETNEGNAIRSEWNPFPPDVPDVPEEPPADSLEMELEKRWILNLSMHFRDRSEREKFFVTYAETPNHWRRVTISCDYRGAPPDSLEHDLRELRYQRDKCARIYESLRESLPEIQFYDTVTNLKLETRDGRLHVHVTEDVNEIIPYPPVSCIGHLPEARLVPENQLHFEAHLSGFVYNVQLDGKAYIKKEIPGPDTVDEFLYEINALHALQGFPDVVQVEGVVVDDDEEIVKGLLIGFAEKGALVDLLYENRGTITWERRERWARQIVRGLCEIHEAGYVQGDFTLSNIVVDADDNAKIIDINRRGCPVGWEPPEIAAKIESNQRISMYIGVKTDIYQLGMTLWALATEEDEPERQPRPLMLGEDVEVPDYYRRLVSICLSPVPRHRLSAKELLGLFPRERGAVSSTVSRKPPTHTGFGVAFPNSALPMYDARAAFLSRQGLPMDSGRDNSDSQQLSGRTYSQDENRILGSPSRSEPYAEMRDWEQSSMHEGVAADGRSVPLEYRRLSGYAYSGSTAAGVLYPTTLENGRESYGTTLRSLDENDVGFDAGIDEGYAKYATDHADDVPSKTTRLFRELEEVDGDGHSAYSLKPPSVNTCSENGRLQESPISSAATQASDLYPAPLADLGRAFMDDTDWSVQDSSRSVSSLMHSILPINPAATSREKKQLDAEADQFSHISIRSALGYAPRQSLHEATNYLCDSHLPINPALEEKTPACV